MADEDKWRQRFNLFMGIRLFGLLVFFTGLAIVFTNLLRPGGWPVVGSIVMILGLLEARLEPGAVLIVRQLLARHGQDAAAGRQAAVAMGLEQGRHQLAPGQITRAAEQDQVERHAVFTSKPRA